VKYCICYFLPKLKQYIYINKQAGSNYSGLVIHPRYKLNRSDFLKISDVHSQEMLNHKSSYRKFPKRYNRGEQAIPYGIPFGFDTIAAFENFITKLQDIYPLYAGDITEEINNADTGCEFDDLSETEKDSVIKSRRGQGKFRESLIKLWGQCSVTQCDNISILKASHIKPWRDSNNKERLDAYNGFLLTPNLDALFDGGLISFDKHGKIILSSYLKLKSLKKLGVSTNEKLTFIKKEHKDYLQYHRDFVFQT